MQMHGPRLYALVQLHSIVVAMSLYVQHNDNRGESIQIWMIRDLNQFVFGHIFTGICIERSALPQMNNTFDVNMHYFLAKTTGQILGP